MSKKLSELSVALKTQQRDPQTEDCRLMKDSKDWLITSIRRNTMELCIDEDLGEKGSVNGNI